MKYLIFIFIISSLCLSCENNNNLNSEEYKITLVGDSAVRINNQVWMKRNLDVERYRNGDTIPQVTDPTEWKNLTSGAWCYYNNDSSNNATYGKLYNWFAVSDPRGLAPIGWRIPSYDEYMTLINLLGDWSDAGVKMKDTGNTHWAANPLDSMTQQYYIDATNESHFTALPGGKREVLMVVEYEFLGGIGYWWTSTETIPTHAICFVLKSGYNSIDHYGDYKQMGFSVRCIKD